MKQRLFYSYNDANGDGINQEYLTTYKGSMIFDFQNRTLYANNYTIGNHAIGSYHGEVFNDFVRNVASGDYSHVDGVNNKAVAYASSAHGESTMVSARGGAAFGRYNEDNSSYIFSIGNGNNKKRSNALTVSEFGVVNVPGDLTVKNRSVASYIDSSYSYMISSYNNLYSYIIDTYNYVCDSYNNLHDYSVNSYNSLHSYITNAYGYIISSYNNLYSYTVDNVSYTHNEVGHLNSHAVLTPMSSDTQLYIWRGTASYLPGKRYSNVLYIVTDEEPSGEIYSE
jgi:hypothetical protein